MKLTPAMKIILAVAAICIAITLITTNNIATVMVLYGLNSTPAVSTGTVQQGAVQQQSGTVNQGGTVQQGGTVDNSTNTTPTPDATQPSGDNTTPTQPSGGNAGTTDDKKPADNSGAANNGDASKMTTQQIVDLYKNGMNKVHSNAKTAVRVKDGALNYKGIVEAGKLSDAASSLMGMFMVADEASIETKNEEWDKAKVPPMTCNLTAAGVKSASCKEEGGKYIVTITAIDQVNPKAGSDRVGSVIDVIQEETITGSISSVPGLSLSNISIAYEDVTVVATIDKATGNVENIKINAPCILSLSAKLAVISIDNAKVGIQVISEFAMTY
ncbi:MAG: hypothetical protein IKT89_00005 [Clostridia bacterium]|nr:hypothetical protein [Clostridia bacterium]